MRILWKNSTAFRPAQDNRIELGDCNVSNRPISANHPFSTQEISVARRDVHETGDMLTCGRLQGKKGEIEKLSLMAALRKQ
ncbi:hypothetical protein [Mesorhizobium sp. LjNodule214]|uniref:hypothetical protein n=1 Tax=Mesorhizobium sp. LjNodule214 TaxID=3342252 RepID=UPI003ECF5FD9